VEAVKMKEYGIGIIGFGFMGRTHTYGYRTMPFYYENLPFSTKLIGVCTKNIENALKAKEEFGFEIAVNDADQLINRSDIDIINICTPNESHKDLIAKALKAGKHVYCDKPMVVNCNEAVEVLEILQANPEASSLTSQIAFQFRFFPSVMHAKQMIDEGKIGRILSFRTCFLHSSSIDPNIPAGWRHADNEQGGGVLFDLGSHLFDIVYYLMGEYKSINVEKFVLYPERPDKSGGFRKINAEDFFMAMAEMKNGALGTIEGSKIATGISDELRMEIHGDKGALRFNLAEPGVLEYFDDTVSDKPLGGVKGFLRIDCMQKFDKPGGGFPPPRLSPDWLRAHVHSLYNFLTCVDAHEQASPSLLEGAYIQYVIEKAFESQQLRGWIEL